MSFQITTAFVEQFKAGFTQRVQQAGSKLRDSVRVESQGGKAAFYNFIGATTVRERTTRHGDSPYIETPHTRRMCTLRDYDWGDYVDDQDKLRTMNDPTNEYVNAAAMSMGRKMDEIIIDAFEATVSTGEHGASTAAFAADGGTTLVHAGVGMDLDKLIEARMVLDGNEASEGDDLCLVMGASQIRDLLALPQISSSDYASVKALVKGEVDTFMGFKIIRVNESLLPYSGGNRTCYAWAKSKMLLALGSDIQAKITEREDKGFATYAYTSMSLGALRMQGEGVVAIECADAS